MACVYIGNDALSTQYAESCLAQSGLHPFLYSRYSNETDAVSPDGLLRNYGGHTRAGLKVLVPLPEVLEAEKVLRELGLAQ